jgi:hypothetical protein
VPCHKDRLLYNILLCDINAIDLQVYILMLLVPSPFLAFEFVETFTWPTARRAMLLNGHSPIVDPGWLEAETYR